MYTYYIIHHLAIECGPLQNPQNGQVVLTGLEVFSVANYECDNGFGINGVNTRVCQPDRTWSGVEPTCERKMMYI